jgi:GDP-4-dehydro-6-deoxy-D-mannose reductase
MRTLITGAGGFVGGHLVERLAADGGHELHGLSKSGALPAYVSPLVTTHVADLLDAPDLAAVVRTVRPEWVVHLAGYASPGQSFKEPAACWDANLTATRNLFDAVAAWSPSARVLVVTSGLVYGDPSGPDDAFDESRSFFPASPYAASKAAADLLAYQVTRNPGLDVVRARPFNHIGPRQSAAYAVANFARQVAAVVRKDSEPIIETGDLSARRDLTDVRDVIDAYVRLLEHGRKGEAYNVGRGVAYGMDEILHRLVDLAGVAVEVRQAKAPGRVGDTAVSRCDATKLRTELGWSPRIPLGQTVRDILDYWLKLPSGSEGSPS